MSSAPVVKGYDGVTLVKVGRRTSRYTGESLVYRYEGPYGKALTFYEANKGNTALYDEATIERDGGKGVVELTVAAADNDSDPRDVAVWELDSLELWVPLLSAEYFYVESGSASEPFAADVIEIEDALSRNVPWTAADAQADSRAWAKRYYGLRAAGVEGFAREVPVIRKTWVASRRSQAAAIDYTTVGSVVDVFSIGVPKSQQAAILGNIEQLPVRTYDQTGNPSAYTIGAAGWEWLRRFPRIRSIRDGRQWEVCEEWWGQWKWSTVLYGRLASWDPTAPEGGT
jgi:hypothetical protein